MATVEVSKPGSKRLSPKGSFKLSLPSLLICGHCKASAGSPPDSPTRAGGAASSRSLSSSASSSRDRLAELREVFRHFDRDLDGKISTRELREFFAAMGDHDGACAAVAEDMDGADGDDDGMLGFQDFVRIVERKGGEEEEREVMRRAFEAFEAVKGSGRITPRGLQRVLSNLGDDRSVADCEAMIRPYDVDGDGELNFHEFHRMMSQE